MNEKYYEYITETLEDVIQNLAVDSCYSKEGERLIMKGKLQAYQDILHLIYDDHEKKFNYE